MARAKTVDEYIANNSQWPSELAKLRKILLATPLQETLKWGAPCYSYGGKNVVGIGAFKSYVGLWFHQGALLSDPDQVLVNAQEGKTRAQRQWRFASAAEIRVRQVRAYVDEAIALQKAGRSIKPQRHKALKLPVELKAMLDQDAGLATAFSALTPGKQREYADHIAEAKREETRLKRVEKCAPMIAAGQGLNDRYRNC